MPENSVQQACRMTGILANKQEPAAGCHYSIVNYDATFRFRSCFLPVFVSKVRSGTSQKNEHQARLNVSLLVCLVVMVGGV